MISAGLQGRLAPVKEGDEVGVGQVADDPLHPDNVVAARLGDELLKPCADEVEPSLRLGELLAGFVQKLLVGLHKINRAELRREQIFRYAANARSAVHRNEVIRARPFSFGKDVGQKFFRSTNVCGRYFR
eukprot:CAMPEP_0196667106 /NCGR_PEP_ID=MMETSP1086-20130531/64896_1 /TAXON_ID=77921 /ORGANISM="Cyanoptyche  gloeocystis , Strain SAG4.97" /LENGTH=129 /DNA_ID=CAMNT_0042004395 /DNA_START=369 /DNA_END=758 /DNA_ORIENTATION=-